MCLRVSPKKAQAPISPVKRQDPPNSLTCTGKWEAKGAVGWSTAPSFCPLLGPSWLVSCSLSPAEATGKFTLFSCPQFPQQQDLVSLTSSHIFLYVPNSCFQPEHIARNKGHPGLNEPPPPSLPSLSARGGDWTGDIPETHPSLSALTSRDPGVLWRSVTTKSLGLSCSSGAGQAPGWSRM